MFKEFIKIKFEMMKKIGVLLAGLALVVLCSSCQSHNCPAYSDNTTEVEQSV